MAFDVVRLHRQEGAGADMQRDFVQADAARVQARQQNVGEMQAGGRRCHRAFVAREHGLVIGAVARIRRTARGDIRRQRHVAALGNRLVKHRPVEGKRKGYLPAFVFL